MSKIAIVGAGFIGRAWAISFARAGHDMTLWDEDARRRRQGAELYRKACCPTWKPRTCWTAHRCPDVRDRMRAAATLEEALAGADYVQENTPENVDIKRAMFRAAGCAARPGHDSGQLDLGHPAIQLHRSSCRDGRAAWWCIRSIRPT